jgi:phospholipid/cholesterol/gamma-HCH transport system ATP-binding protein
MISVRNVYKSFGSQVVLNGVTMEIEPGKTTAVVGPSGVGKSVLLKLIMGIMTPDEGEIFIEGENITAARSESRKNEIRRSLGVLFQAAALFDSLTVYDNIAFPLLERTGCSALRAHEKVLDIAESLSLTPYLTNFPEQVSIGIRKRVGMARALVTEPKVVLVDEPNTGLDPLDGQEVYDLINACKSQWGFTGLVISHELPEVFQVSDRVAMLLGGQVICEGTPAELIASTDPAVQQFLNGRTDGPIKIQ